MKKIGLLSVLLLGLCACGNRSSVTMPASVFEKVVDVLSENNEIENEQSRIRYYRLLQDLDDPAKAKLSSLIIAIQKLESNRLEFDSLMAVAKKERDGDQEWVILQDKLNSIDEFIRGRHTELYKMTQEIIENNAKVFNLGEDDKAIFIENMQSRSSDFLGDKFLITQEVYRETNPYLLRLLLLKADFFVSQQIVEEALTQLAYSSGGCWIDMVFPVVFDVKNGCLNRGDTLEAKIGIGSYSSLLYPEHTQIIVNGDTLTVDDSGVALFKKQVNQAGALTLDVQCIAVNPYNGMIATGNGQFIYDIN